RVELSERGTRRQPRGHTGRRNEGCRNHAGLRGMSWRERNEDRRRSPGEATGNGKKNSERRFPMRVNEVMTRGVECVGPDATLQEAAARMKSLDVGTLPVCDHDGLVGMVTDRDITVRATAEGDAPTDVRVRDIMTPEIVS